MFHCGSAILLLKSDTAEAEHSGAAGASSLADEACRGMRMLPMEIDGLEG